MRAAPRRRRPYQANPTAPARHASTRIAFGKLAMATAIANTIVAVPNASAAMAASLRLVIRSAPDDLARRCRTGRCRGIRGDRPDAHPESRSFDEPPVPRGELLAPVDRVRGGAR